MNIKTVFLETRPQFLLLSVVLAFLGTSIAWYDGAFRPGYAVLAFAGLLLAHISVNTLNDYFDYKSGVDLATIRTPFSGGSGILPAALLKPGQVFWIGMISFLLALAIGVYFMVEVSWMLLPVIIIAAICVLLYTPVILKIRWPEWAAGLGLGTLPIVGMYFVQTADYLPAVVVAAIPSGILVHNLLLLNEFPDADADRIADKKTLPIILGKKKAGKIYSALTVAMYLWIVGAVAAGQMPVFSLIALLTLPLAIRAIKGALNPNGMDTLIPAMGNNVMVILLTQLLLGISYLLAGALG